MTLSLLLPAPAAALVAAGQLRYVPIPTIRRGRVSSTLRRVPDVGWCASAEFSDVPAVTVGAKVEIETECYACSILHRDPFWCEEEGCADGYRTVATATVARVLPIKTTHPFTPRIADYIFVGMIARQAWIDGECVDLSDHAAHFAFAPGGHAVELTDVVAVDPHTGGGA